MSEPSAPSHFISNLIDADLAQGKYAGRRWRGSPGGASDNEQAAPDPSPIRTRFPPEPNGYLHIGHAKSICLNFGLAQSYAGRCHMRFDDTNPAKEEQEYVDSILDAVRWLGFDWGEHLYYASDYFETLYRFAELFIEHGLAYVDSQSAEEIRSRRGSLTEPGQASPFRDRTPAENLALFRAMRAGQFADGAHVLRLKIDMASPNINMRDPSIYRIRHAEHHRTGKSWCVYPLYDYTHCISDALENITHSICTLEFQDHRPLYDWVLQRLAELGALRQPLPQQIEFARLNLSYTVLSKRKLIELVEGGFVTGWDDPRLPTLAGLRRRGYSPESIRSFAERIGVSKADSVIDYGLLEECLREHLNQVAQRRLAVLKPLRLIIENYPAGQTEVCEAPNHPHQPELGRRKVLFGRELWIEREDFMEHPTKGYFRLALGAEVRLRYAYIVRCESVEKNASGEVTAVFCRYDPSSRGADARKVKGNIHWVAASSAQGFELRLYERLFRTAHPGRGDTDYLADLNPDSMQSLHGYGEAALADARAGEQFQFERMGYFVADRVDSTPGRPVFNRAASLKDSWAKHQ